MRLVGLLGLVLHGLLLLAAPGVYLARDGLVDRILEPDPAAVERAVRALEARLAASGPSAGDPEVAALLAELRAAERGRFRAAAARQFLAEWRWLAWIVGNSLTALPLHGLLLAAARRLVRGQLYALGLARRVAGLQIARLLAAAAAYIVWIVPAWVEAEAWAFAAGQEPARAAELAARYAAWLGWVQVLAALGVVLVASLPPAAWLARLPNPRAAAEPPSDLR